MAVDASPSLEAKRRRRMLVHEEYRKCVVFLLADIPDEETGVMKRRPAASGKNTSPPTKQLCNSPLRARRPVEKAPRSQYNGTMPCPNKHRSERPGGVF